MNLLFYSGSNPIPEAGRVVGLHPGVLVHMEQFNRSPVNSLLCKGVDKRDLRISGRTDHSRPAMIRDGASNDLSSFFGGGITSGGAGAVDLDVSLSGPKAVSRPGWLRHGGIIHRF